VTLQVMAVARDSARLVSCGVAELVALCRRAAVVVGGDSGPVHLAAALGRPVVGLYGPTDPARNGPWGPGPKQVLRDAASATSHKRVPVVEAGLARMEVRAVLSAVQAALEGSQAPV
jgi:heptosyltransferase-1